VLLFCLLFLVVFVTDMSKIPLKDRKAIKEAVPLAEDFVKKASDALGVSLQCVNNTEELYVGLGASSPQLAENFPKYFERLFEVAKEFAADEVGLGPFKERLNAVNGKIQISLVGSNEPDRYWNLKADALHVEVKQGYWGSWLSYYNKEYMEKNLSANFQGVNLSIATLKNIQTALPKVHAHLQRASAAYGAEITWEEEKLHEIFTWLEKNKVDTKNFGDIVEKYSEQFANTFSKFVENSDNKEAIQEVFTTNKVGIHMAGSSDGDLYFLWKDGVLLLQVKSGYWGSWLSYYNEQYLEKTL